MPLRTLLSLRITKPKRGHPKHPGSTLLRSPAQCPAQVHRSMQLPALEASGTTPCRCYSPLCGLQPTTAVPPPSPTCRLHHSPQPHPHTRRHPRASRPSLGRLSEGQPTCPSTDAGSACLPACPELLGPVPLPHGWLVDTSPQEDQCTLSQGGLLGNRGSWQLQAFIAWFLKLWRQQTPGKPAEDGDFWHSGGCWIICMFKHLRWFWCRGPEATLWKTQF